MATLYSDFLLNPSTGDLDFTDNQLNIIETNQMSLRQRLYIRFSIWQGDYFFDENIGFPYNSFISKRVLKVVLDNQIKETTRLENDVLQIQNFQSQIDQINRIYSCIFEVITKEGDVIPLAFVGNDKYSYPDPNDDQNSPTLCDQDGFIKIQHKLYYLINFRLPTFGDFT